MPKVSGVSVDQELQRMLLLKRRSCRLRANAI